MSMIKKQGKKQSNDFSIIDSASDWETDNSSVCSEKNKSKPNGPKRIEKSFHISSMGENVEETIKEKTVCEDGVQVLHSSEVKLKLKQQEKGKNEQENDGPLQMAPDPSFENRKENEPSVRPKEPSVRPKRLWEPESDPNGQNRSSVVNNWPIQHQGRNSEYDRSAYRENRCYSPFRNSEKSQVSTPLNPKCAERTSYHISSVGEDGEETLEESSICEDGFQIFHFSAYKKKMKRLEKLKQKNTEELESMKKTVVSRFLLT